MKLRPNTTLRFCLRLLLILLPLLVVFGLALPGSALAASGTVMLVTDRPDLEQGTNNLAGYLRSLGYTVTVDEGNGAGAGPSAYRGTLDATEIARLESFNLVIVHRATSSGDFMPAAQWNNLNVPLLLGSAYLARTASRWDWAPAAQLRQTNQNLTFSAPTHPIVNGLASDIYTAARDQDVLSSSSVGNGTLVATAPGSGTAIAVWDTSGSFTGAAGQQHIRRRVFFLFIRYHETDTPTAGVFTDYSPNGLTMLARAVAYTITGTAGESAPEITQLVPGNGALSHPATNGIRFHVQSSQPVTASNVSLILNGVNVSASLTNSGSPTDLVVSFFGLVADTNYTATITASNILGVATTNIQFDTFPPDVAPPAVLSSVPAAGATISNLLFITVTFSEAVTNVGSSDLLINELPAIGVSGSGATYTFEVEQPAYGPVSITWDSGTAIADRSGNPFNINGGGATWQYQLVDSTAPVILNLNPPAGALLPALSQIEITFSETVAGVHASDLFINGTAAASVSGMLAGPYVFQFSGSAASLVQVTWAGAHGITDTAAIPNAFVASNWTYTVDDGFVAPQVRINEFLSATLNTNGLRDEFGQQEDWIELHNFGSTPVNIGGFSLTGDSKLPAKWILPSLVLGGGEYLVVFASGRDRAVVGGTNRLHTNFKLNANGNYLALFDARSPRVVLSEFAPEFPEQRNDHSYGYDSTNALRYYSAPTPGASNGNSSILGVVPPPHFNVRRGFFDAPFRLVLSESLTGATVRYTTDGSQPTAANGQVYTGPLTISNTVPFRAAAFKTNHLPSTVSTHTYIFLDQVLIQPNTPPGFPVGPTVFGGFPSDYEMDPEIVNDPLYRPRMRDALTSLPVLSLVMKNDDMFGPANGIYTHSESRGPQWEKGCSAEFVLPDGSTAFQVDCGIQMQGNANRTPNNQPKHAFRVVFKGDYGPGRLEYPLFPDSPVQSFNTLVLRADYNNSWLHWDPAQRLRGQRTRDAFVKDSMRAMGGLSSHNRFFQLYINGLYWGIYDFSERPDADFAASYLGGQAEAYDVLNEGAVKDGNITAYNAMLGITGLNNNSQYGLMKQYLDMTQFIDYMLLHFWAANHDWGLNKNWYTVRYRAPGEGFKYVPWDGERTLEEPNADEVSQTDVPSSLHTRLLDNLEYRLEFADRVHKHFFNNGALMAGPAAARWRARTDEMFPAMIAESARWGDYRRDVAVRGTAPLFTYNNHFIPEQNRLLNTWFPVRANNVLNQLRTAGLYPAVTAPTYGQHGGAVARGFNLAMSAPAGVIYYTTDGTDPRVAFTGAVAPAAQAYAGAITLNNSAIVKARVLNGTTWSALNEANFSVDTLRPSLRITEIMYNPSGGDAYEFVEIQNVGTTPVNMGNYHFDGIAYLFPANTFLAPGQVIILASANSPSAFAGRYPGVTVFGRFGGSLANAGDRLALKDAAGRTVVSVDFDDEDGWPAAADGAGYSLEILDSGGNPDDPANWRASATISGTPGMISVPPSPGLILLNELMADNVASVSNAGTFPDWLELHNAGASDADLSGWSLTDDSVAGKFKFPPSTVLPAGGYLVVWCDESTNATPGLHTGFALDRDGETISLHDAASNRVDAVSFGVQLTDLTVGRISGQWELNNPTPNAANQAAPLAAVTNLTLNEWLANPPVSQDDWVELFNRHATLPVGLRGLYISTSNGVARIESLSFIAPLGYRQLLADSQPGARHLDVKFPLEGGAIRLHDAAGLQIEQVLYGPQAEGVSQGRLPDGGPSIVVFPGSMSPEASNYLLNYNGPRLNEVSARNMTAVPYNATNYVDWIELHNPTASAFDMEGMRLSDNPNNPAQWLFPAGVSIPPGGYLVIWFDGTRPASFGIETDLNTGRALDGNSGGVYLFNTGGQLVDSVDYGFQIIDLSIGRSGSSWKLLSQPTPAAANAVPVVLNDPLALRINEWLADAAMEDDWFELYNFSGAPVELTGLYLTDDLSIPGRVNSVIGPLSFIDQLGFVKVVADGNGPSGRNHVNFSLDSQGEAIRLYGTNLSVIDTVFFGQQSEGISQGRLPDGYTDFANFTMPTPAEPNALAPGPPLIIENPQSQTVLGPSNVTFRVRAVGQGTLTYQWWRAGLPLAGRTQSTLALNSVQSEDQGEYYAVVTSGFGSATSAVAVLTVQGLPSFVVLPQSQTVLAGSTVTFSVVTRGGLPINYRWRRTATLLQYSTNSHQSSLTIQNVQPANAGNYTVVLTNVSTAGTAGIISSPAVLTVLADADGDGMADTWENENMFDPALAADAAQDADGDGYNNRDEYVAGTNPRDPESYLRFREFSGQNGQVFLSFAATSNRTYSVLGSDTVAGGTWSNMFNIDARSTNRFLTITNILLPGVEQRFYRLVAPRAP